MSRPRQGLLDEPGKYKSIWFLKPFDLIEIETSYMFDCVGGVSQRRLNLK